MRLGPTNSRILIETLHRPTSNLLGYRATLSPFPFSSLLPPLPSCFLTSASIPCLHSSPLSRPHGSMPRAPSSSIHLPIHSFSPGVYPFSLHFPLLSLHPSPLSLPSRLIPFPLLSLHLPSPSSPFPFWGGVVLPVLSGSPVLRL